MGPLVSSLTSCSGRYRSHRTHTMCTSTCHPAVVSPIGLTTTAGGGGERLTSSTCSSGNGLSRNGLSQNGYLEPQACVRERSVGCSTCMEHAPLHQFLCRGRLRILEHEAAPSVGAKNSQPSVTQTKLWHLTCTTNVQAAGPNCDT